MIIVEKDGITQELRDETQLKAFTKSGWVEIMPPSSPPASFLQEEQSMTGRKKKQEGD